MPKASARETGVVEAPPCKGFALARHFNQYSKKMDSQQADVVPLDLTVNACVDGIPTAEQFHVTARLSGLAKDLQKTLDAVARASCSKDAKLAPSPSDQFSWTLSNVKMESGPRPQGNKQHLINIAANIAATPCGSIEATYKFISTSFDLTHTVFYVDVKIPLKVDSKTLFLSFGEPETKFIKTDRVGPTASLTEAAWVKIDADKMNFVGSYVAVAVKDQIAKSLNDNPANPNRLYFRLGENVPADLITNLEITSAKVSTINGALDFDVSLNADVPRSVVESYIRPEVELRVARGAAGLGLR